MGRTRHAKGRSAPLCRGSGPVVETKPSVRFAGVLLRLVLGASLLLLPLSLIVGGVGRAGPTLLYWSNLYNPGWIGPGRLPARTWKTLTQPGAVVYSDCPHGFYWTCVAADDGDFMLAIGPEGLALASASDVTPNWEGQMRTRWIVPHWVLLGPAACVSAISLSILAYLYIRGRCSRSNRTLSDG